jgi:hypothetical protein
MRSRFLILTGILVGTITYAHAQWVNYPDARTPRTKDGKPDLSARAPRLNGKPDLSGLWQSERTRTQEYESVLGKGFTAIQPDTNDVTKYALNVFWGMKAEEEPLRPEAVAIMKQRRPADFPPTHCLPDSVPASLMVFTFKIIQTPQEVVMLSEGINPARQIYTDGRPLPKNPDPTWMGYSSGHWEGDTFVAETIGITERAWLDGFGHPRSDAMHITERYHRRDFGHMDLEITLSDPKYYTRSFGFKTELNLVPDSDVLEFVCNENEKDLPHLGK